MELADNLKTHIKMFYDGQKYHNCNICGKSFSTKLVLKQHINNIHKNLKKKNKVVSKNYNMWGLNLMVLPSLVLVILNLAYQISSFNRKLPTVSRYLILCHSLHFSTQIVTLLD